jgi:hypothetical protein
VLLVSSNLEAFTPNQRSRLEREFSPLESEQIQTWLLDVDLLEGHPFFEELDAEIEASIVAHLEENVSDPVLSSKPERFPPIEQVPLPVEHQTVPVDEELQSKMRAWANDSEHDEAPTAHVQEEELAPKEPVQIQVKPRTPQRMVRKRRRIKETVKKSPINAAASHRVELPTLDEKHLNSGKPFVPNPSTKEHVFPESMSKKRKSGMQQAVNSASTRKVAQFPPIKSTGHVAKLHPKSEEDALNIEPSLHAREQASARQRRTEDES